MADIYNAEMRFRDEGGNVSKSKLKNIPSASAPDMTKLLALATSLRSYTSAGLASYKLLKWTYAAFAGTLASIVGLNTVKALINVQYTIGGIVTHRSLFLPNPAPAKFEMVTGEGLRMTSAARTALGTLLSTLSGLTVTVIEGKIVTRTRKNRPSPAGNCVAFVDEANFPGYLTIPSELVTSAAALATFTGGIDTGAYSNSKVTGSYFLTETETQLATDDVLYIPDTDTIPFGPVETAAIAKLSYTQSSVRKHESITLPGVKSTVLSKSGDNWRLNSATGEGVALALTSFYGSGNRALQFAGSRVKGKNLQSQAG